MGIIFTETGLGGSSFNDLALEGVKKAAADYGITYDEAGSKSVSGEEIIQDKIAASGDYGLITCVEAEQVSALTNMAPTYPEQRFALLDAISDLPNTTSYSCKEQEGVSLIGVLATLTKQRKTDDKLGSGKTIGFIGDADNSPINHFAAGHEAEAGYIEPEMKVLVDYAGGLNDPTAVRTTASIFVEKGADVVFYAAGASGMDMLQAIEERGFTTIGVNLNQNNIASDYIMASMPRKLNSCAYHVITSIVKDTYTGENQMPGPSDRDVDVTTEGNNVKVPDDILTRLNELKQKIISGEIQVPSELN